VEGRFEIYISFTLWCGFVELSQGEFYLNILLLVLYLGHFCGWVSVVVRGNLELVYEIWMGAVLLGGVGYTRSKSLYLST
jgi:hypothetical protein